MNPKKIVTPLQQWLLNQGRCVGCGWPLNKGTKKVKNSITLVTCHCQRIFVYQPETKIYRRALFKEVD